MLFFLKSPEYCNWFLSYNFISQTFLATKILCLFLILFFIVCTLITCLCFPLHRPFCDPSQGRLWASFWGGYRKLFERSFRRNGLCEDPESFLCMCTSHWQQWAEVLCTHDSISRHLWYHWEALLRNLSSISPGCSWCREGRTAEARLVLFSPHDFSVLPPSTFFILFFQHLL